MEKGIPRFMIESDYSRCSPVTEYTAKKDGTFIARCYSVPGFVFEGETFEACAEAATTAYLAHCKKGIWN